MFLKWEITMKYLGAVALSLIGIFFQCLETKANCSSTLTDIPLLSILKAGDDKQCPADPLSALPVEAE